MIPYGRQQITEEDIAAVTEILQSDFLTQGPVVPAFERALCDYAGAEFTVAANSATSMLHLACLAMDLKPGGLLWTSPLTFVASSNVGLYCGAEVDFVDVHPETLNLDPDALARKLVQARENNRLPDIVIPVHFGGLSCDMEAIASLADEYGFRIIEDASHAIGGQYRGKPVGSCEYSDITVFSFHPVKIITTAEGGAATTRDATLAQRMRNLREHGVTREPGLLRDKPDGPWSYDQIALGFNYRMTEMQAALGCSQLKRLDSFITRRNALADRYHAALTDLPLSSQIRPAASDRSACHLYVITLDAPYKPHRRQVFEALRDAGIGVNVHYQPVYTQPYYRDLGFAQGLCPVAEAYYEGAITLPLFPALTEKEQDYIVETLHGIVNSLSV